MLHNTKFIQDFMAYYDYPQQAVQTFTAVLEKLDSNKSFAKTYDRLYDKYQQHKCGLDRRLFRKLNMLAFRMGFNKYTLHFCFLLSLTENLRRQYDLLGIDRKIFYDTMADMRYKLIECMDCKKVPGAFSEGWSDGFFRLNRVCYGRFQFEVSCYNEKKPFTMKCGHTINKGDVMIGFHIPSSGVPLTDEIRMESYKEAYRHFNGIFPDGKVIFCCGSWLLYPAHKDFLPPHLNILRFMDDFEIVHWHEDKDFHNAWRIYGATADLPPKKWPVDTSLRKAYAERMISGGKAGSAMGVFMFDGEKIIK